MSTIQRVAQAFGVIFVILALAGFVASGGSMESDPALAPKLLGLFPVNVLHNLVHLALGVWGLLAARSFDGAVTYARVGGGIYAALAVLAFVTPSLFGLVPIGGHDIWLHAVLAAALLVAGFTLARARAAI